MIAAVFSIVGGKEMQGKEYVDQEWLALMIEAKKAGISIEEVKKFLKSKETSSEFLSFIKKDRI
ncbi:hypothetical protein CJ483_00220 [Bacillus sp. PK3_68]|nr:hypothetical protein CJ483_00220 [Bacillus sp. PK3_68]